MSHKMTCIYILANPTPNYWSASSFAPLIPSKNPLTHTPHTRLIGKWVGYREMSHKLQNWNRPRPRTRPRPYLNYVIRICRDFLATFTEEDYYYDYDTVASYIYTLNNVCRPLLFYIEFVLRENTIKRFREVFYTLKFKQRFRFILWEKVRLPKIQNKYHPDNLNKMLELHGDIGIDELDALMDTW